tara:strand:- start:25 stop:297 length:273 start_codon:yes stop_codon:yes gene_type:complete
MNGNNKSTASRLLYCIYIADRVLFPSKTLVLSIKVITTSARADTQFAWLKNEYQKVYKILRRKARIQPKKAIFGGLFVGLLFDFGTINRI